ncbi:hypothetical protein KFE25_009449 [Diacronema lutheri]|uniref:Knr4/Smi1-like domain-containing protein n=1 Tax=Diacronema lutheri TaxID=2081491 RepID=A0A8J5XSS8_DIALT|nr:hypothetical protein KFE25_009449 [Diacronema lutheri]
MASAPPFNGKADGDELAAVCAAVVTHLESLEGVRNVQLAPCVGARQGALHAWERHNYPAQLPAELRAFYELSDGLSLTWSVEHMGDELPLGCMHVNDLKRLVRADIDPAELRTSSVPASGRSRSPPFISIGADGGQGLMAFDLDSTVYDGQLCLLYCLPATDSPQVWFQDLSRAWYFVAGSFGDYLRLVLMHLGLPRWQHAYTDVGLDPTAKQWIRLFAPHRLEARAEFEDPGARARSRRPTAGASKAHSSNGRTSALFRPPAHAQSSAARGV